VTVCVHICLTRRFEDLSSSEQATITGMVAEAKRISAGAALPLDAEMGGAQVRACVCVCMCVYVCVCACVCVCAPTQ